MGYGGGDLEQTIRLLLEVGGVADAVALRSAIESLQKSLDSLEKQSGKTVDNTAKAASAAAKAAEKAAKDAEAIANRVADDREKTLEREVQAEWKAWNKKAEAAKKAAEESQKRDAKAAADAEALLNRIADERERTIEREIQAEWNAAKKIADAKASQQARAIADAESLANKIADEREKAIEKEIQAEWNAARKKGEAAQASVDKMAREAQRSEDAWVKATDKATGAQADATKAIDRFNANQTASNRARAEAAVDFAEKTALAEQKAALAYANSAKAALDAAKAIGSDTTAATQKYQWAVDGLTAAANKTKVAADQAKTAFSKKTWGEENAVGILHVAHAFQDLQYGVGAVLNNVPLLAQAFGVPAQYAGGLMIAAVGVNLAFEHGAPLIREYASAVGLVDDITKKAATSADEYKAKIEALEGKRVKLDVDYENITKAKEDAEALNEALSAYESGKKTDTQKVMASENQKVIEQFGGSKAFAERIEANEQATAGVLSRADPSDLDVKQYKNLRERIDSAKARGEMAAARELMKAIEPFEAAIRNKRRQSINAGVGAFATGDESQTLGMAKLAEMGVFDQVGPGGLTGNEAILGLTSVDMDAQGNVNAAGRETVRRRLDSDEEAKQRDEAEKESVARRKAFLKAEADARKQKDVLFARDAKKQDDEEKGIAAVEAADEKHRQAVFEQGLKTAGKADHDANVDKAKNARDAARAAKAAPGEAQKAQEKDLAGVFQKATGATDDQSAEAGKKMAELVDKGMSIQNAGNVVLSQIVQQNQRMEMMLARQAANMEIMAGYVGPAVQRLAALEAQQNASDMLIRRMAGVARTSRPSRLQRAN